MPAAASTSLLLLLLPVQAPVLLASTAFELMLLVAWFSCCSSRALGVNGLPLLLLRATAVLLKLHVRSCCWLLWFSTGVLSQQPLLLLCLLLPLLLHVRMLCSTMIVKMACDRLDCSFSAVAPVVRASAPTSSSRTKSS
jgi:hypothetical protein